MPSSSARLRRVGGVVLAAGESRRMGAFKPLLPFGPGRILERVLDHLLAAGVDPCVVVLGHRAGELWSLVEGRGGQPVLNPRYRDGMLSSVQCGVAALPPEVEVILIALGDQPEIGTEVFRFLLEAFQASSRGLAVPSFRGQRGHPFLVHRRYREEILQLSGERGLRELRDRHPEDLLEIPVDTPAVLQDLDHPQDYQAALARLQDGEAERRPWIDLEVLPCEQAPRKSR